MNRDIRLNVLGPFEARRSDGRALELSGRKIQGLVTFLAVEGGRIHSREEVATLLWAETGQDRARHNLRQALSKLRKVAPELLEASDDTLALSAACTVDVREFERLLGSDRLDDLERAVDLYRHDLLAGVAFREEAFGDWLWDARTRLRDLAGAAMERLALGLSDAGRSSEAEAMWRRRLGFDPACEPAHRSLMQLLADAGRRSDALRQYERCAAALDRELGVRPGPETEALLLAIRSSESPSSDSRPLPEDPASAERPGSESERPDSAGGGEPPAVAVLAFESLSPGEDRYFADGIAEDIVTSLSRFGSLLVISRESSFAFRDQERSISEIGRRLNAQFIVRGSVRTSGSRMRLNVQLIDATTGTHLWAQHYDRELEDLFAVQDDVTQTVVATLAGRVEAARISKARRKVPERLDAYEYVLRGMELHHRMTAEACERSIEMFERAIERDSGLAMAHAWLGCGLGQAMIFRPEDRESLLDRAEAAALRAREIDESDAECHRILFHVAILRREVLRARSHLERALSLNPNDDRIVCAMGNLCTLEGRHDESEGWIRKAMRLNPFHAEGLWFHLARALFHAGRDDEALEALARVTTPRLRELVYRLALHGRANRQDEARRVRQEIEALSPGTDPVRWAESEPYVRPEDRDALVEALRRAGEFDRIP